MKNEEKGILANAELLLEKVFNNPRNSHILIGFINDILDLGVTEVDTVENAYSDKAFCEENKKPYGKQKHVSVLVKRGCGRQAIIEMQVYGQDLVRDQTLLNVFMDYAASCVKSGMMNHSEENPNEEGEYSAQIPVYSVNILIENDFTKDDRILRRFTFYDEEHDIQIVNKLNENIVTTVFFEINKPSNGMKKNAKAWVDYFRTGEVTEEAPEYLQEVRRIAEAQNSTKEE